MRIVYYIHMKKLTTKEWVAVVISIFIVGFFFIFGPMVVSVFNRFQNNGTNTMTNGTEQVKTEDVVVGMGDTAVPGSRVTVNYTGHLQNGTVFDSSVARNEPFQFVLGTGTVIPGWDIGIVGMKVGGKRTLTIPPAFAYGSKDYGPIPANSTLIFDVELLKVEQGTTTSATR